jgi:hypothetical protein
MAVPATVTQPSESCGPLQLKGTHAITYIEHTGRPRPDYIVGPVVATARLVEITLSNGKVLKTRTIAPKPGLARSLRFYAQQLSCGVRATRLLARDGRGRVVAQRSIRKLLPENVFLLARGTAQRRSTPCWASVAECPLSRMRI